MMFVLFGLAEAMPGICSGGRPVNVVLTSRASIVNE
jgi:hypothetical protein